MVELKRLKRLGNLRDHSYKYEPRNLSLAYTDLLRMFTYNHAHPIASHS